MAKYLVLIYGDEREWAAVPAHERRRLDEGHRSLVAAAGAAAIAAVHAQAPTWQDTDWTEIVGLYDVLLELWPSPVVELNRAVAVGFRDGPQAGLDALEPLSAEPSLAGYGYLSAARGDFLRQLHQWTRAAEAYEEALMLCGNDVERSFLVERLDGIRRL